MTESWYTSVSYDKPVTQGDLVEDCPVLTWRDVDGFDQKQPEATLTAARHAVRTDVVTMTQACDLEQHHVSSVTLCPHHSLSRYQEFWEEDQKSRDQEPTKKSWRKHCDQLKQGFAWNLAMLARVPGGEVRVVDFHHVFTVPRAFLETYLHSTRRPRHRLLPPLPRTPVPGVLSVLHARGTPHSGGRRMVVRHCRRTALRPS